MKRLASVLMVAAFLTGVSLPAGAALRYGSFGNSRFGDCTYASLANLTQNRYPSARIATNDVVSVWRAAGEAGTWMPSALAWMKATGYDGHRISSSLTEPSTRDATIERVRERGAVIAMLHLPTGGHAALVTRVTKAGIWIVNDGGTPQFEDWRWWNAFTYAIVSVMWSS